MIELHIRLFEVQGEYQAEIIAAPAGETLPPATKLSLPPPLASGRSLNDLQAGLLELQPGEAENELQDIGQYLFRFLFGPKGQENPLYGFWLKHFRQGQQDKGMRTILLLDSEKLLGLPWELLCTDNGRYLAAWAEPKPHNLLRARWKADDFGGEALALPAALEPLRVLLVVAHAPEDDERIMGPDEALRVDTALFKLLPWKVDVRVLVRPTLKETLDWAGQWKPHVFHYIGHGDFDGVKPYLKFYEPGQPDAVPLDPAALANFFAGGVPRLVILNACRSGQVGGSGGTTQSGSNPLQATQNLSKVLIEGGVLAVIAMQADIVGQAAANLMGEFYQKLAQGQPIDLALTAAREAVMRVSGLGTREWDWALPVLYLSAGRKAEEVMMLDEKNNEPQIFEVPDSESDRYKRRIRDLALRAKIQVGREREQLALERAFLKADFDSIAPVTLLYGEPTIGKTNMLYWLTEGCARQGRQFIYADFDQTPLDYWESLRLIRDGQLEAKVSGIKLSNRIETDVVFNTFNYALNTKLIKGYAAQNPVAPDLLTPVADLAQDKNPATELENLGTVRSNENPIETINEAFWNSLARAARPNGLIIFLDHVDKLFSGEVNKLRSYLLNAVLKPESYPNAQQVRFVLAIQAPAPEVANTERPWDFLLENPKVAIQRLAGLPPQELRWLARMWARRYFFSYGPAYLADYLNGRTLTVKHVDEYVTNSLSPNFFNRPQRPSRLVEILLDRDNIADWLSGLP